MNGQQLNALRDIEAFDPARKVRDAQKRYWAEKARAELEVFERTGIPPGLQ